LVYPPGRGTEEKGETRLAGDCGIAVIDFLEAFSAVGLIDKGSIEKSRMEGDTWSSPQSFGDGALRQDEGGIV
jgi:hypothetical protein